MGSDIGIAALRETASTAEAVRRRVFLTAQWRYLLMLNFEVRAEILAPLVPRGTEVDLWDGRALVSVVGFRFLRTRVLGVGVPFHSNFSEVNLRFYVRREMPSGEVRRGVVFIREIVPRIAVSLVARGAYNENFFTHRVRSVTPHVETDAPGRVSYGWRTKSGWHEVAGTAVGEPLRMSTGSEEEFIAEHYWGYTRQRDGGTVEFEVERPRWRVWKVEGEKLSEGVAGYYGEPFAGVLKGRDCSALLAEGSGVYVYWPRRIEG
jgi:uncharacterized protein